MGNTTVIWRFRGAIDVAESLIKDQHGPNGNAWGGQADPGCCSACGFVIR